MLNHPAVRSNPFLALVRISKLSGLTIKYLVLHFLATRSETGPQRTALTLNLFKRWAQRVLSIMGIQVKFDGDLPPPGSLLVPNHQGYMDIPVLASSVPLVFVSKAEVSSWPVLGFLLRRGEQLTLKRRRKKDLVRSVDAVTERLRLNQTVCVFLEGTSSGGNGVGTFHPSMIQPAIEAGSPVVPIAIRWGAQNTAIAVAEDIAYWKDHNFVKHVWRLLGLKGIRALVLFGTPIEPGRSDRHELAAKARACVVDLFRSTDSLTIA